MKTLKKYLIFIISLLVLGVTLAVNKETGLVALDTIAFSFKEMIMVLPPIFILIGLLDVWVPSETMARYMGEDSGLVGILLSIRFVKRVPLLCFSSVGGEFSLLSLTQPIK